MLPEHQMALIASVCVRQDMPPGELNRIPGVLVNKAHMGFPQCESAPPCALFCSPRVPTSLLPFAPTSGRARRLRPRPPGHFSGPVRCSVLAGQGLRRRPARHDRVGRRPPAPLRHARHAVLSHGFRRPRRLPGGLRRPRLPRRARLMGPNDPVGLPCLLRPAAQPSDSHRLEKRRAADRAVSLGLPTRPAQELHVRPSPLRILHNCLQSMRDENR